MAYSDLIKTQKRFIPNVVIQIDSTVFAMRPPDSGLSVPALFNRSISSLVLNPTSIDIKRVNTTIASYSFRLVDIEGIITALVNGNAANLIGKEVTIWLGRNRLTPLDAPIPFSDYYQLPKTRVKKIDHSDNSYGFSSNEDTDRINQPLYDAQSALAVDILSGTTTLTMRDPIDAYPASGFLKIDDEYMSYASKNDGTRTFNGVIRGELNSVPASHSANTAAFQVETILDNPLNILLRLLISNGGGGIYDDLQDGCGLDENLIDLTGIENLRDTIFDGVFFRLSVYNLESALKFIETEILQPCNLRFTYSKDSKLTLAILDKAIFVEQTDVLNDDTITKYPKWSVDDSKIVNSLKIAWDYDEGANQFRKNDLFEDASSIATYGRRAALNFSFKGVKDLLGGQELITDYGDALLRRLARPIAEVAISTQIDKSLQTIGDKAMVETNTIPTTDGTLNFATEMEIVERAINFQTGDVNFKLAFTSFTGIRSAYIAPSDVITSIVDQHRINIDVTRAHFYLVGWYMRLWDTYTNSYCADLPNEIVDVIVDSAAITTQDGDTIITEDGDVIIQEQDISEATIVFKDDWVTPLDTDGRYKIRPANYDEAVETQKRYAFLSDNGNNFNDGKPTYKVTY